MQPSLPKAYSVLRDALAVLKTAERRAQAPEVRDVLSKLAELLSRRAALVERVRDASQAPDAEIRARLLDELNHSLRALEDELAQETYSAREVLARCA